MYTNHTIGWIENLIKTFKTMIRHVEVLINRMW